MILSSGKFIVWVKYSVMIVSIKNKWIISLPSVCIDSRSFEYLSLYYRHKLSPRTVLYNTHKYSSISLKHTKHRSLACSSSSPFSANTTSSKVTLIKFVFSGKIIPFSKTLWFFYRNPYNRLTKSIVPKVNRITIYPHNSSCLSGGKIFKKIVKNLSQCIATQFTVLNHTQAL